MCAISFSFEARGSRWNAAAHQAASPVGEEREEQPNWLISHAFCPLLISMLADERGATSLSVIFSNACVLLMIDLRSLRSDRSNLQTEHPALGARAFRSSQDAEIGCAFLHVFAAERIG